MAEMREFSTGATRNLDENKFDYEGFLSPVVLEEFAKYMNSHRLQADGKLRDSDNWQKGIPQDAYMKSLWRHFHSVWKMHRGYSAVDENGKQVSIKQELTAMMFNVMGYLYEEIKKEQIGPHEDWI